MPSHQERVRRNYETSTTSLEEWLQSKEFYELMQTYRHTPVHDNKGVVAAFEAVKTSILKKAKDKGKISKLVNSLQGMKL